MSLPYRRELIFRSSPSAHSRIPLSVRSTGHYLVQRGWHEIPRRKHFTQLFWCARGSMCFRSGSDEFHVGPLELFKYEPNEIHDSQSGPDGCEYFWMTFDHPEAPRWIEGLGIPDRVTPVEIFPGWAYAQLRVALRDCTLHGERQSAKIAHSVLLDTFSIAGSADLHQFSIASKARSLMDAEFRDAQVNISSIVAKIEIHRATLFRTFRAEYGVSPSTYLQNLRIQYALSILRESSCPIQEVAIRSGFSDANYFARAIRRVTGVSPKDFRHC